MIAKMSTPKYTKGPVSRIGGISEVLLTLMEIHPTYARSVKEKYTIGLKVM